MQTAMAVKVAIANCNNNGVPGNSVLISHNTVSATIAPIIRTSPWAKLISCKMP